ncbi:MAG: glycosyltransferase [Pleurocapsa sp. MO_192.B19]|nr:glycosyltransferase [Pleurocapsa sp. MO_192.B19]
MTISNLYFLTVNYNSSWLITRLIKSLPHRAEHNYKLIIVNNSPNDKEIFKLENDYTKIIKADKNLGFGKACNLGLTWIEHNNNNNNNNALVWLINPDAYFTTNILSTAIAFFKNHPQISILGTTVYNSDGEITFAGGTFIPGKASLSIINSLPPDLSQDYIKTDWVSGCSLLINLANFPKCPQFDPRYFLYYEDLDFCLRYSQQGHQIAVTHLLKVLHETSSITNRNVFQKYKHITQSYLIHIEKHGNYSIFFLTNIRILLNTLRLIIIKPQQGLGKLVGFYNYWQTKLLT